MSITSDGAVGFAGLSHLGIVSSIVAAAKGFSVVGWDLDADLVSQVQSGSLPIVEPGLDDLLAEHREQLMFTADISALSACRLVYVAQDVPTDDSGRSNLDAVNDLLQRVGVAVKPGTVVVLLSQVPPGFTREAAAELISNSLGSGPELFYQVETLVFGNAVERALTPERIIVGCPNPGVDRPEALTRYLGAFDCPILPMRYESAELCKIAINMFLVSTLATTNMLAELCEMIGAVWEEIAPALRLDRRIGRYAYLNPGLGVGGGNLLRDVATVQKTAARHQVDTQLLDAWLANIAAIGYFGRSGMKFYLRQLSLWWQCGGWHIRKTPDQPSVHRRSGQLNNLTGSRSVLMIRRSSLTMTGLTIFHSPPIRFQPARMRMCLPS